MSRVRLRRHRHPYWTFALGLVSFGCGMGLSSPPATEAIIETLPRAKQGVASAVNDVSRELGGALGIAILGSALTVGYRRTIDDQAGMLPPQALDAVRDSPALGYQVAQQSPADTGSIIETIQTSLVDGHATKRRHARLVATAFAGVPEPGPSCDPRLSSPDDVDPLADEPIIIHRTRRRSRPHRSASTHRLGGDLVGYVAEVAWRFRHGWVTRGGGSRSAGWRPRRRR